MHACCNGYLVSPLRDGGVGRERSQRRGELRLERLSVVVGVRSDSEGSSPLLLFPSLLHSDPQFHTDCIMPQMHRFQKFPGEILLSGVQS